MDQTRTQGTRLLMILLRKFFGKNALKQRIGKRSSSSITVILVGALSSTSLFSDDLSSDRFTDCLGV